MPSSSLRGLLQCLGALVVALSPAPVLLAWGFLPHRTGFPSGSTQSPLPRYPSAICLRYLPTCLCQSCLPLCSNHLAALGMDQVDLNKTSCVLGPPSPRG